jgi:hypothetical protein
MAGVQNAAGPHFPRPWRRLSVRLNSRSLTGALWYEAGKGAKEFADTFGLATVLQAGKTYKLTVPRDVPVNKFWSLTNGLARDVRTQIPASITTLSTT